VFALVRGFELPAPNALMTSNKIRPEERIYSRDRACRDRTLAKLPQKLFSQFRVKLADLSPAFPREKQWVLERATCIPALIAQDSPFLRADRCLAPMKR
jgi:hypothetical protein